MWWGVAEEAQSRDPLFAPPPNKRVPTHLLLALGCCWCGGRDIGSERSLCGGTHVLPVTAESPIVGTTSDSAAVLACVCADMSKGLLSAK